MNFREFQSFFDKTEEYDVVEEFIENLCWNSWMDDFIKRNSEEALDKFVTSLFKAIKGDVDALFSYAGISKNSFKTQYEYDLTDLKFGFEKTREYKYLVYIVFVQNCCINSSTKGIYFGKIDRSIFNNLF